MAVVSQSCAGSFIKLRQGQRPLRIEVNGEAREVPNQMILSNLIEHLALAPERLAIELNREVVRRGEWSTTVLTEGDRLEIIHFVGGGRF